MAAMSDNDSKPLAAPKRRRNWKPIGMMMLLGLGFFVLPTLILFSVAMAPTLVAYVMDRRSEKYAAFSVGCMNFCGSLPFALDLWLTDHSVDMTGILLTNPYTWVIMYGAAGVGWGIHLAAPYAISIVLRYHTERRIARLKDFQEELVGEWGREITQSDADEEDVDEDALPPDAAPMADPKPNGA